MNKRLTGFWILAVLLVILALPMGRAAAQEATNEEAAVTLTQVLVDGVAHPIDDLAKLDEQYELHLVMNEETAKTGTLLAYTDRAALDAYLLAAGVPMTNPKALPDDASTNCGRPNLRVRAFQHSDYGGDMLCLNRGNRFPHLRNLGWNDRISSVRTDPSAYVRFWQHSDYTGDSLILIGRWTILHLRAYGWNDRISSVIVYQ